MSPAQIIQQIETDLLINLMTLLSQGKTGDAEWQLRKIQQYGMLEKQNLNAIKKNLPELEKEIKAEIEKIAMQKVGQIDRIARNSATFSGALRTASLDRIREIIATYEQVAKTQASSVIDNLVAKAGQQYLDLVSKTQIQVLSGIPIQKAMEEASTELAKKGVPALVDRAGRTWTPEAYTQMMFRTTITQTATATQLQRMDELEMDLVEISSHAGARPKCEPYQGKVYSLHGKTKGYPLLSDTSYGEPDGLFGVNCGHTMYPYIPGTPKTYDQYPKKENAEVYEQSQKQRAIERNIRSSKRELSILESNSKATPQAIKNAQEKLARQQSRMSEFISETGRTRRIGREQVY